MREPSPTGAVSGSRSYLVIIPLIASLGGFLFGFDTAVISGAISFLEAQYHLNSISLGWLVSSALLTCILGAGFAGMLSDLYGRRRLLLVCAILFLVSAVGCAFAGSFAILVIARMVGGLAIGAASMLSPLYIAEFAPARLRGGLVALYQFAITLGILAAYFSNAGLARLAASSTNEGSSLAHQLFVTEPWRAMLGAEGIPALVFLALLIFVPESPRWLVEKGKPEEAFTILSHVSGPVVANREIDEIERIVAMESGSVWQLLEPRWRRPLLVGIVLPLAGQISGINSIIYYGPKIFEQAGLSLGASLGGSITVGIILCFFTLLALWKVDSWGRRPLLLAGTFGCAIVLMLVGLAFQFHMTSGPLLLVLISLFLACFAFSLGPIPWIVISEIFPTDIRGRAMSIGTLVLWIGCAVVSQTFPWLLENLKPSGTFWLYGILTSLSLVATWRLVPETKGKSLEQIEIEWQTKSSSGPVSS